MELTGMWPYWKDGSDSETVRNDITLDGVVMLTGEFWPACQYALHSAERYPLVAITDVAQSHSHRVGYTL